MLAIGRVIMSNAKFLAMDEPSLGLAPHLRIDVFKTIKQINQSGVSILLVEQNVAEAAKLADRIYLMEDGRIVFKGGKDKALSNRHIREVFRVYNALKKEIYLRSDIKSGHRSVALTMDVYSHRIEGMQSDAMGLLDEVLPAGVKNSVAKCRQLLRT